MNESAHASPPTHGLPPPNESMTSPATAPRGIPAAYFDGKSARRTEVRLQLSSLTLAVVDLNGNALAHVPKDLVRVSDRIANTPYRLEFPDGALAVTSDHAAIERSFRLNPRAHWLAKLERAPWAVAAALLGLFVALFAAYQVVIPKVAAAVAERIPRETETSLGQATVKSLDAFMFKPTALSAQQQAPIRESFDRLAKASGIAEHVTLEFRKMAPNALAIPGGTIVVTDGLVTLFGSDERLLSAVIAHELGHVHYRHSLKHLLSGSASALIVGALAGDVSGVSALVTSAPVILSALAYSRDAEREADLYAFDLLRKVGRSPKDFADAMRRFHTMEDCFRLRDADRKQSIRPAATNTEDDEESSDDASDQTGRASESSESPAENTPATSAAKAAPRASCMTDPDQVVRGREAEAARLRSEEGDRETGYVHTHPVTEERIRAAEAAALR
ncbi:MAG: hypothetical protein EAZ21_10810 [Betaproteobacteria bacterium]|nr:MAG: hypothetical protein EAZ21_10810 [Betaproteobacteria bacterium]